MKRLVTLGSVVAFMLVGACGKKPSKAPKAPAFTVTAADVAFVNATTATEVVFIVNTAEKVELTNTTEEGIVVSTVDCCDAKVAISVADIKFTPATAEVKEVTEVTEVKDEHGTVTTPAVTGSPAVAAKPATITAKIKFPKEGTYTVTVKGLKVKGSEKATEVTTKVVVTPA